MKKIYFFFVLLLSSLFLPQNLLAQTCQGKSQALETIGSISGGMLYNTYVSIGVIADGFHDKVYDAEYTRALMDEQITLIASVDSSLMKLEQSGFLTDTSDIRYLKEIRIAFGYLSNEAYYLKLYANDSSDSNADNFQYYREKAWKLIAVLLDIKED